MPGKGIFRSAGSDRQDLEQRAHRVRPGETLDLGANFLARRLVGVGAEIARRVRAGPWRAGSRPASPDAPRGRGLGCRGERREIDMRGQVGLAGIGKHVLVVVLAQRLQRVAEAGLQMAVVDEQPGAAVCGDAFGDRLHQWPCGPARPRRSSRPAQRRPHRRQQRRIDATPDAGDENAARPLRRGRSRARANLFRPCTNWRTGMASKNSLPTMNSGASGSVCDGFVPGDVGADLRRASASGRRAAAGWSRPGEGCAGDKGRIERAERPQHVLHQRAAAGADLGEGDRQSGRPIACQAE